MLVSPFTSLFASNSTRLLRPLLLSSLRKYSTPAFFPIDNSPSIPPSSSSPTPRRSYEVEDPTSLPEDGFAARHADNSMRRSRDDRYNKPPKEEETDDNSQMKDKIPIHRYIDTAPDGLSPIILPPEATLKSHLFDFYAGRGNCATMISKLETTLKQVRRKLYIYGVANRADRPDPDLKPSQIPRDEIMIKLRPIAKRGRLPGAEVKVGSIYFLDRPRTTWATTWKPRQEMSEMIGEKFQLKESEYKRIRNLLDKLAELIPSSTLADLVMIEEEARKGRIIEPHELVRNMILDCIKEFQANDSAAEKMGGKTMTDYLADRKALAEKERKIMRRERILEDLWNRKQQIFNELENNNISIFKPNPSDFVPSSALELPPLEYTAPEWKETLATLNLEEIEDLERKLTEQQNALMGKQSWKHVMIDDYGRAYALGRRKTSSAKVWMVKVKTPEGSKSPTPFHSIKQPSDPSSPYPTPLPLGQIIINGLPLYRFAQTEAQKNLVLRPFVLTKQLGAYNVWAVTRGGGLNGQCGALALAMSKCLDKLGYHEKRPGTMKILRKAKLLRRDPRMVERKKPGAAKARKKYTWVKR